MSNGHFENPEPGDLDDDGYVIGLGYVRLGICSECGEEGTQDQVCPDGVLEPIE